MHREGGDRWQSRAAEGGRWEGQGQKGALGGGGGRGDHAWDDIVDMYNSAITGVQLVVYIQVWAWERFVQEGGGVR